jgi:hypothetical protein
MPSKVARKSAPQPLVHPQSGSGRFPSDHDDSLPTRQLQQEAAASSIDSTASKEGATKVILAAATAHFESSPKVAKGGIHNGVGYDINRSVDILANARGRKKLNKPSTVQATSLKRRVEEDVHEILGDEEENDDDDYDDNKEVKEDVVTPRPTRQVNLAEHTRVRMNTRRARMNTRQARDNSGAMAAQLPKHGQKAANWTAYEDATLTDMINHGVGLNDVQERLSQFTSDEIRERAAFLENEATEAKENEAVANETPEAQEMAHVQQLQRTTRPAGDPWTEGEDARLLQSGKGTDWTKLSHLFPGRTIAALKNRHRKLATGKVKRKPTATLSGESPNKKAKAQQTPEPGHEDEPIRHRQSAKSESARKRRDDVVVRNEKEQFAPSPKTLKTAAPKAIKKGTCGPGQPRLVRAPEIEVEEDPGENGDVGAGSGNDVDYITAVTDVETEDDSYDDDQQDATPVESDIDIPPDSVELHGQAGALIKVLNAAITHKMETYIDEFRKRDTNELDAVKAIKFNKDKIRKFYQELATTSETSHLRAAINDALAQLQRQTKRLRPETIEVFATKRRLVRQVNILVFADLLSVLSAALKLHADSRYDDYDTMTWELECCIRIMQCIVDLYRKSRSGEWIKIKIHGIKEIRSGMLVPLQKVLEKFQRERRNYLRFVQHRATQQASQRHRDVEEEEDSLKKEYIEKYDRLRGLFIYRIDAARDKDAHTGKFKRHGKTFAEWKVGRQTRHGHDKREVHSDREVELDSDGNPIERVDAFGARVPGRRPPRSSSITNEDETEWTNEERYALLKGLKDDHGESPLPYEHTPSD